MSKNLKENSLKSFYILIMAPWHKTSKKVKQYFKQNQDTIIVKWLPPKWPELNPVEECWKQGKNANALGLKYHPTFAEFITSITDYYRTRKFQLNVFKYLCR